MPKTREIKRRIGNVKNIKQITKAMNAIAMAKVTKMKKRLEKTKNYVEGMKESSLKLSYLTRETDNKLVNPAHDGSIGIMVFNSDRGLCGRYKDQLNRSTRDFINSRDNPVELYAG